MTAWLQVPEVTSILLPAVAKSDGRMQQLSLERLLIERGNQRLCELYCLFKLLKGKTRGCVNSTAYWLIERENQRLCELYWQYCLLKGKTRGCVNSTAHWKGKPEAAWILLLFERKNQRLCGTLLLTERENQRLCELYCLLKGKTIDGSSWCVLLLVWFHGNFIYVVIAVLYMYNQQ